MDGDRPRGFEGSRQTDAGVHRIEFAVDWPPGHVAAYLVDGDEPVLVDAGMPGDGAREELLAGLDAAGCGPADVAHLVVTHPHVDHVGQVPALLEAGDPTVYAPVGVRERLARDPDALAAAVSENAVAAGLDDDEHDAAVEKAVESLERDRELLSPEAVDVWVADGDRLDAGGSTLKAIHTPGHQADHLCFTAAVGGERVVFSGDMVMEPFRSVGLHVGLDHGVEATVDALYAALDRLAREAVDRVYPGHGPVHDDYAGAIARSRRSLDRLVERARNLVAAGAGTAAEVARRRGLDRPIYYTLPETVSALARLEADGRLVSAVESGVRRYRVP